MPPSLNCEGEAEAQMCSIGFSVLKLFCFLIESFVVIGFLGKSSKNNEGHKLWFTHLADCQGI